MPRVRLTLLNTIDCQEMGALERLSPEIICDIGLYLDGPSLYRLSLSNIYLHAVLERFLRLRRIIWASRIGDEARLRLLLANGLCFRHSFLWTSKTALVYAIIGGHQSNIELLIDQGFDPNEASEDGETPLFAAARMDNVRTAGILLAQGANTAVPAAGISRQHIGLHSLSMRGEGGRKMATELLRAGTPIDACNVTDETAVEVAGRSGNIGLVEFLFSQGADIRH